MGDVGVTMLLTNDTMPSGAALLVAWVGSLQAMGGYASGRMHSVPRALTITGQGGVAVLVFIMMLQFALGQTAWGRTAVIAFAGTSTVLVFTGRVLMRPLHGVLSPPAALPQVAIIGTGERAQVMAEKFPHYGQDLWNFAGFIEPSSGDEPVAVPEARILGPFTDLTELIAAHRIEVLVLATKALSREQHLVLSTAASDRGLRVLKTPDTWGVANPRPHVSDFGGLQLVDMTGLDYPPGGALIKRLLDIVLVSSFGVVLTPLLLITAALIRVSDGGPALFTQSRSGKGGKPFPMFKFRSMVVDAESQRDTLQSSNASDGVLFKLKDDPRITPLGRWLRRWSIDELPQLLNVLRGDMNLVGPRPLPIADLQGIQHDPELMYWFHQRSKVKPGITGTWQVAKRDSLKMEDMVRLDIDYIQGWSIASDLVLLLRTVPAITRGRNAL